MSLILTPTQLSYQSKDGPASSAQWGTSWEMYWFLSFWIDRVYGSCTEVDRVLMRKAMMSYCYSSRQIFNGYSWISRKHDVHQLLCCSTFCLVYHIGMSQDKFKDILVTVKLSFCSNVCSKKISPNAHCTFEMILCEQYHTEYKNLIHSFWNNKTLISTDLLELKKSNIQLNFTEK